jgi:hypothetical protein
MDFEEKNIQECLKTKMSLIFWCLNGKNTRVLFVFLERMVGDVS